MKYIFFSALPILILLLSFSKRHNGCGKKQINYDSSIVTEKVTMNELEIQNSDLISIIDSFLLAEPLHKLYDTIYLTIDVYNYNWKVGEKCMIEDTMIIEISSTFNKSFVFQKEREGFFRFKNIYGSVDGILMPSLFKKSGKVKYFGHEKNDNETIIKIISCDDFSWFLYYIDGAFSLAP